MKKALALLLALCLIFTALPFNTWAVSTDLTITTKIDEKIYYTEETFKVTLDLSNNADGFSSIRGRLNYDSDNITLIGFNCNADDDTQNNSVLSASYSRHNGYLLILWTVGPGLVNYQLDGVIAELEFAVNKNADNKTYNFDFEYLDGTRYTYGATFKDTDWIYIEKVETFNDSFIVDTSIDSMLYFENAPTGAYLNESVSLDIAFSGEKGLYIFKTYLHYDKENFEFNNCVLKNTSLNFDYNVKDGYVILLFDNNTASNFNEEGVIATVTFDVKENATLKDYKFSLEYVEAAFLDFSNGVSVKSVYFNALSCQFPLLSERVPVTLTLNRGNSSIENITLYKGEKLLLPDTNFFDKNWYTNKGASNTDIFAQTVCPAEDFTLYSSACAVDYDGSDPIVKYRYNQQFEVETENGNDILSYSSVSSNELAKMFRLDKLNDNTTYKLTITYKANIENSLGLGLAGATGTNMYVGTSYFEGNENTSIYNFVNTNEYKTTDIYFTASLKGTVKEQSSADDTKDVNGNVWAYFIVVDENTSDKDKILIKDIQITEIPKALNAGGASLLTEAGFASAGYTQAIRYYFNYTTNEDNAGLTIKLGDITYDIVERGFLYRNGAIDKYCDDKSVTKEEMNLTHAQTATDMIIHSKSTELNACWQYDSTTKNICFSTYVNKYTEDMYSQKLMIRGFITFRDQEGNEFTIYSAPINRCVNGMMETPVSGVNAY